MKTALKVLITLAVVVGFLFLVNHAIRAQEVVDCNKLVAQSQEFAEAGFYITSWQKDMCDAHGISINAPVK